MLLKPKLALEETLLLMRKGFVLDLFDTHKPCDYGYRLMDLETEGETRSVQRWSGSIWESRRAELLRPSIIKRVEKKQDSSKVYCCFLEGVMDFSQATQ